MAVNTARLLIACPDGRGIIAAVAKFIAEHGGNIVDADQHTDPQHGEFFMRVEIDLNTFVLDPGTFEQTWSPLATRYAMRWRLEWGDRKKRMAILVSRESHCLNDLLWRFKTGELEVDVAFVASNHRDWQDEVEAFGIAYHYLPVTPDSKPQQETELTRLLEGGQVDFLVLARYMQPRVRRAGSPGR